MLAAAVRGKPAAASGSVAAAADALEVLMRHLSIGGNASSRHSSSSNKSSSSDNSVATIAQSGEPQQPKTAAASQDPSKAAWGSEILVPRPPVPKLQPAPHSEEAAAGGTTTSGGSGESGAGTPSVSNTSAAGSPTNAAAAVSSSASAEDPFAAFGAAGPSSTPRARERANSGRLGDAEQQHASSSSSAGPLLPSPSSDSSTPNSARAGDSHHHRHHHSSGGSGSGSSSDGSTISAGSSAAAQPGGGAAVVTAASGSSQSAAARERDREKSRRIKQLEDSAEDMQRTIRQLTQENRQLKKQTTTLYDHERELVTSLRATQARVRALLQEAAAHGYVPTFYRAPQTAQQLAEGSHTGGRRHFSSHPHSTPHASQTHLSDVAAASASDGAIIRRSSSSGASLPMTSASGELEIVVGDEADESFYIKCLSHFERGTQQQQQQQQQQQAGAGGSSRTSPPAGGGHPSSPASGGGGKGASGAAAGTSTTTLVLRNLSPRGHLQPDGTVTLRSLAGTVGLGLGSPEFAAIARDVCGFPAYFNPLLFARVYETGRAAAAGGIYGRDFSSNSGSTSLVGSRANGELVIHESAQVSAEALLRFWATASGHCKGAPAMAASGATGAAAGSSDRVSRFWHLVRPTDGVHVLPPHLRPLLHSLVDFHPDLARLRSDPVAREGYVLLVLHSVFASLHGQRSPRISAGELRGSNLVDAFYLVASQTTRHVLPFSVAYHDDFMGQWAKLRDATAARLAARGLNAAAVASAAARHPSPAGLITADVIAELREPRLTPYALSRVFSSIPRRLACGVPGGMCYEDFVVFWLAEKDRMADTSIAYWFRVLDVDDDGYLSVEDLTYAYAAKVEAQVAAGMLPPPGAAAVPSSSSSSSSGSSRRRRRGGEKTMGLGTPPSNSPRGQLGAHRGLTSPSAAAAGSSSSGHPSPSTSPATTPRAGGSSGSFGNNNASGSADDHTGSSGASPIMLAPAPLSSASATAGTLRPPPIRTPAPLAAGPWPLPPSPLATGDDSEGEGEASPALLSSGATSSSTPAGGGSSRSRANRPPIPLISTSGVTGVDRDAMANMMASLVDFINPAVPGRVSPIDIKRSGAGQAIFDVLLTMAPLPSSKSSE